MALLSFIVHLMSEIAISVVRESNRMFMYIIIGHGNAYNRSRIANRCFCALVSPLICCVR